MRCRSCWLGKYCPAASRHSLNDGPGSKVLGEYGYAPGKSMLEAGSILSFGDIWVAGLKESKLTSYHIGSG